MTLIIYQDEVGPGTSIYALADFGEVQEILAREKPADFEVYVGTSFSIDITHDYMVWASSDLIKIHLELKAINALASNPR